MVEATALQTLDCRIRFMLWEEQLVKLQNLVGHGGREGGIHITGVVCAGGSMALASAGFVTTVKTRWLGYLNLRSKFVIPSLRIYGKSAILVDSENIK